MMDARLLNGPNSSPLLVKQDNIFAIGHVVTLVEVAVVYAAAGAEANSLAAASGASPHGVSASHVKAVLMGGSEHRSLVVDAWIPGG
jgi:hypothetical protein